MPLHVLVLAGGSGTRLWPLSRRARPKHLLPLGPEGITLLQSTVERVLPLTANVHVVTTESQAEDCRVALAAFGDISIIAEPLARGTGPALGLANAWVSRHDPDAVVCSVHADHHVLDDAAYREALFAAASWATATEGLATVGIRPTAPATGYGYVELGPARPAQQWAPLDAGTDASATTAANAGRLPAYQVAGFIEKPPHDIAVRISGDGRHLWNLGLFAWQARVFAEEIGRADGGLADTLEAVVSSRLAADEAGAHALYDGLTTCAVEPLVMERTTRLTVVGAGFPWSDLGAWPDILAARQAASAGDEAGNVVDGDGVAIASSNCLISSQGGRMVAVVGADNLIVIDTGDAVLVVPAAEAQRVKEMTDWLSAAGRSELR